MLLWLYSMPQTPRPALMMPPVNGSPATVATAVALEVTVGVGVAESLVGALTGTVLPVCVCSTYTLPSVPLSAVP